MTNRPTTPEPRPVAEPARLLGSPPYTAKTANKAATLWYVENAQGYNALVFPGSPGATFTTEQHAREIVTAHD